MEQVIELIEVAFDGTFTHFNTVTNNLLIATDEVYPCLVCGKTEDTIVNMFNEPGQDDIIPPKGVILVRPIVLFGLCQKHLPATVPDFLKIDKYIYGIMRCHNIRNKRIESVLVTLIREGEKLLSKQKGRKKSKEK